MNYSYHIIGFSNKKKYFLTIHGKIPCYIPEKGEEDHREDVDQTGEASHPRKLDHKQLLWWCRLGENVLNFECLHSVFNQAARLQNLRPNAL